MIQYDLCGYCDDPLKQASHHHRCNRIREPSYYIIEFRALHVTRKGSLPISVLFFRLIRILRKRRWGWNNTLSGNSVRRWCFCRFSLGDHPGYFFNLLHVKALQFCAVKQHYLYRDRFCETFFFPARIITRVFLRMKYRKARFLLSIHIWSDCLTINIIYNMWIQSYVKRDVFHVLHFLSNFIAVRIKLYTR